MCKGKHIFEINGGYGMDELHLRKLYVPCSDLKSSFFNHLLSYFSSLDSFSLSLSLTIHDFYDICTYVSHYNLQTQSHFVLLSLKLVNCRFSFKPFWNIKILKTCDTVFTLQRNATFWKLLRNLFINSARSAPSLSKGFTILEKLRYAVE